MCQDKRLAIVMVSGIVWLSWSMASVIPGAGECFTTVIGQQCCQNTVLSWVQCGNPPVQCNTAEEYCETLLSCAGADVGWSRRADRPCLKRTVFRRCTEGACEFVDEEYATMLLGCQAAGEFCPVVPPSGSE